MELVVEMSNPLMFWLNSNINMGSTKARNMVMEHRQELKMVEEEMSQDSTGKKMRQAISIPFVWEVIPGTPKKDWKPTSTPPLTRPRAPPPVKLIASVPFGWEEKPGKPLPYCSQPSTSSPLSIQQAQSNSSQSPVDPMASIPYECKEKPGKTLPCNSQSPSTSSPLVLPKVESSFPSKVKFIASVPFEWEEKPGKPLPFLQPPTSSPSFPGLSEYNKDNWTSMDDQDGNESEMLESDPETCDYETDDGSFTSAPSLSADNLTPTTAVVPLQQSSPEDLNSGQLKCPGSTASETESTSSYATGTTSLVGASFLEWLFPLLAPHSSFLDKVGCSESVSQLQSKEQSTDFHQKRNYSAAIRRPPTLGELIMISRRRSYQRKAIQMQTENLSKEIMKRNAMGCGILGTSNILSRLDIKWKRQLQL